MYIYANIYIYNPMSILNLYKYIHIYVYIYIYNLMRILNFFIYVGLFFYTFIDILLDFFFSPRNLNPVSDVFWKKKVRIHSLSSWHFWKRSVWTELAVIEWHVISSLFSIEILIPWPKQKGSLISNSASPSAPVEGI